MGRGGLADRVGGYKPEWLDELCFSGEVTWARLSPKQGGPEALGSPSRATPLALSLREELPALLEAVRGGAPIEPRGFEATRAVLEVLQRRGALFLHDLSTLTRLSRVDVTQALWDLIGRGIATADGFQGPRPGRAHGRDELHDRGDEAPEGDRRSPRGSEPGHAHVGGRARQMPHERA